jgi:hypothetical protein
MANVFGPIDKCERCQSAVWDNRTNKKNPKGPDFKCKNPDCGEAFWLAKEKTAPRAGTSVPKPGKPVMTWHDLQVIYGKCLDIAVLETAKIAKAHTKLALPSWDNVMAGSATLFIQAVREGLRVVDHKPVPKTKEDFAEDPWTDDPWEPGEPPEEE